MIKVFVKVDGRQYDGCIVQESENDPSSVGMAVVMLTAGRRCVVYRPAQENRAHHRFDGIGSVRQPGLRVHLVTLMREYYLSESDDMPRVSTSGVFMVLCFIHQKSQEQPVFNAGEMVVFTRPWNEPLILQIVSHTANPLHRDMLHTVIGKGLRFANDAEAGFPFYDDYMWRRYGR